MSTDSFDTVPFDAFGFDDIDPDKPGTGGGGQLPKGGYRVTITEVNLQNDRGSTEVKCEVVAADDATLIGHNHTEYLKWPKAEYSEVGNRIAKEQLLAWCYAAKTTSPDVIRARQQARQGFDSSWLNAMVGRSVLIYVKPEEYEDKQTGAKKTSTKVDGRVWALDNPKGKGIPGWIAPPVASPTGTPVAAPTTQATTAPPPQQQQQTAAADPFAGLV